MLPLLILLLLLAAFCGVLILRALRFRGETEEPLPAEEEILQKHREIYLHQFGQARYDQFIQIPLLPGEKPFALTDWTEDQ